MKEQEHKIGKVEISRDEFLLYCNNIVRNPDNPPEVVEYATHLIEWIEQDRGMYIQRFYVTSGGDLLYDRKIKGRLGFK